MAAHATLRAGNQVMLPGPLQLRILIPGTRVQDARELPRRSRRSTQPLLGPKDGPPVDDVWVCPATVPGQVPLFEARRRLGHAQWLSLAGRSWPEESKLARIIADMAHARGLSSQWCQLVRRRVRLALALRDAEGARHIDDALLAQIHYGIVGGAREALRRAGLMRVLTRTQPAGQRIHACAVCGSWGLVNSRICNGCRGWAQEPDGYPEGSAAAADDFSRCTRGSRCAGGAWCTYARWGRTPSASRSPSSRLRLRWRTSSRGKPVISASFLTRVPAR
ncbi:hypothetical protein ACWGH5_39015 [Streptomyces sp. NPDC054864]